jgi:hypothetical protein
MLEDHAEEVGVVERNRKLQMPALAVLNRHTAVEFTVSQPA